MNKILILGATGNLGRVLVSYLLIKDLSLVVLVRNPEKLKIKNSNLIILKGNADSSEDLQKALTGVSVVISVLGHGFRTKYSILKNSLECLIPIMKKKRVKRFITVTGAGLKTKDDQNSLMLKFSEYLFEILDPYRLEDAKTAQRLLEESNLDWIVVRTPIHKNNTSKNISYAGFKQPVIWRGVSRLAIAKFIYENINGDKWVRKSPIIY